MEKLGFTYFLTSHSIPKDKRSSLKFNTLRFSVLMLLPMLFSACGGSSNKTAANQTASPLLMSSSSTLVNSSSVASSSVAASTSTDNRSSVIGDTNNGKAAPTLSDVQVDGSFGVVTLNVIAKDDVKLFDIEFLVDDTPTGWAAHLNTDSDAPADQYYVKFDSLPLTSGPHRLVVKVRDYDDNLTISDDVIFNIDSTAGFIEIEPNNDLASANVIADNQFQIAGTLKNTKENSRVDVDYDYYKVSVPAGKTLTVTMLALPSTISLSIHDSNGNIISGEPIKNSSEEEVSYINGAISNVVYIRASAGPIVYSRDQYKLSLRFH